MGTMDLASDKLVFKHGISNFWDFSQLDYNQ